MTNRWIALLLVSARQELASDGLASLLGSVIVDSRPIALSSPCATSSTNSGLQMWSCPARACWEPRADIRSGSCITGCILCKPERNAYQAWTLRAPGEAIWHTANVVGQ